MRALVTGSEGFIGSHLVDELLHAGYEVIGVDDGSAGARMLRTVGAYALERVRVQDYRQSGAIDVVFHLAGKVGPLGVLRHAGMIALDTIEAADAAARIALRSGVPLIDISTSEVYGSPDHSNSEDDPKVFFNASARQEYAVSKYASEVMLLNIADLDVRIIRPFNVAGPRQRAWGGFVLPRFIEQALSDRPLTVYGDGSQRRAFTHVKDIVSGIVRAHTYGQSREVYNLGSSVNECSILELAEEVVGYVGSGRIAFFDPKALHGKEFQEAPDKTPNAEKAKRELGWHPVFTREMIIADMVRELEWSNT